MSTEARRFERLERVTWQRREFHPVGETRAEMAACMEWVRSLGHEAKSLEDDGFRYRSVYRTGEESDYITLRNDEGIQCSGWQWAPPGTWLMHMHGEGQDPELDSPHSEEPDDGAYGFGFGSQGGGWHEVSPLTTPPPADPGSAS
jgi:hypothetical protein